MGAKKIPLGYMVLEEKGEVYHLAEARNPAFSPTQYRYSSTVAWCGSGLRYFGALHNKKPEGKRLCGLCKRVAASDTKNGVEVYLDIEGTEKFVLPSKASKKKPPSPVEEVFCEEEKRPKRKKEATVKAKPKVDKSKQEKKKKLKEKIKARQENSEW